MSTHDVSESIPQDDQTQDQEPLLPVEDTDKVGDNQK
jgi:hypothetical protein